MCHLIAFYNLPVRTKHCLTTTPPKSQGKSSTSGNDESWRRLLGEDGHPAQLEIQQLAQALSQVERAALGQLGKQNSGSISTPHPV